MSEPPANQNRYHALLEHLFRQRYEAGKTRLEFDRAEFAAAAKALGIELPKNLGDVIYSVRYRTKMPASVVATQPEGMEWIVEPDGRSRYAFKLVRFSRVVPRTDLATIAIPDATPEIIVGYAQGDEQALLAKVRYNRLIDIFLGLTTYSLQNHLRTTLKGGSQIEIDELYIGIDRHGCHYVIPVQAKGGTDQISVVQTGQDLQCCAEKFPGIRCRAVSTQFMGDDRIVMFELAIQGDEVKVVEEKHYKLVPSDALDAAAIRSYR